MSQAISFCTAADGVRIAYAAVGAGPPLVKAANWLNHLEYDWESPAWRHWFRELSRDHRLYRYDARGNGLSDREVEEISFEAFVRDLEAVTDAAGLERFDLLGISQGCAVSVAYAVRHPERVGRMVLYGGYAYGRHWRGDAERERSGALRTLMAQGWGQDNPAFRQIFTSQFMPEATPEQVRWFNELQRVTTSPRNAVRIREACDAIDVRPLLAEVRAPTLVIHGDGDAVVPLALGRELAAAIPGARFVQLHGLNHVILEDEPAWPRFLEAIREFLGVPTAERTRSTVARSRWARVDELFEAALDRAPEERPHWLGQVCADDARLRREVEHLLALAETDDDPLHGQTALDGPLFEELATELEAQGRLRPGERLGPYEILGVIATGGMGEVYRARHTGLDREVAVKAMIRSAAADPAYLRRFHREARLLASLAHPNVATVHDLLVERGRPYLVLELVRGETLRERLRRGPLTTAEAIATAAQLAAGIEEAHRRGIVHRDLKPSNVTTADDGCVKILDFGLAKAGGSAGPADDATSVDGQVLGTPGYMSPEQARGEAVDQRSDVWAFGCLLYEMLSGERAFGGGTASDAIAAVLRDEADWSRLPPDTPPALVALLRRCLEKDPEARLPEMGEARRTLAALAAPS